MVPLKDTVKQNSANFCKRLVICKIKNESIRISTLLNVTLTAEQGILVYHTKI